MHHHIAILLGARLSFKVLIAAENGLLPFAKMAEGHTEDEGKFQVRKLDIKLLKFVICQFFLVRYHD